MTELKSAEDWLHEWIRLPKDTTLLEHIKSIQTNAIQATIELAIMEAKVNIEGFRVSIDTEPIKALINHEKLKV